MKTNAFANVDTASISSAINNFIQSLNEVDYSSSGCFAMSTNAKYDGTFNNGIEYLKGTDIASMIALCDSCNSSIIAKINEYKSYYTNTYEPRYNTWNNAPNTITVNNKKQSNPAKAAAKEKLNEAEKHLDNLEAEIKSASF